MLLDFRRYLGQNGRTFFICHLCTALDSDAALACTVRTQVSSLFATNAGRCITELHASLVVRGRTAAAERSGADVPA